MRERKYLKDIDWLIKEYDFEKNTEYDFEKLTCGSHKKINWICNKGHRWQDTINHRLRGDNCPYCSGHRVISGENDLATLYPEIAEKWDYEKNEGKSPKCYAPYSGYKAWWKCAEGHVFQSRIADMVVKKINCPYCYGRYLLPGENDLKTVAPELCNEWHPIKNGDLRPENIMAHTSRKVWWKCKKGHEWQASTNNRMKGKGCPYCSGRKVVSGENDLATMRPDLSEEWHPTKNKNGPESYSVGSNKKVWWKCEVCGYEWLAQIGARYYGSGCPVCTKKKRVL